MPMTIEQHRASLHQPAFSELLPVRDILNDVIIRTTGALVAGYELSGINSYYHNDDGRNRTKLALEALIRSLPERSMRMQVRFEIAEGLGDLRERYRSNSGVRIRRYWLSIASGWTRPDGHLAEERARRLLSATAVARLLPLESYSSSRTSRRGLRQRSDEALQPRYLQPVRE